MKDKNEVSLEALREMRATVEKVDKIIEKNNQSAARLLPQYRRALFAVSEAIDEAMKLHQGVVFLLQMARVAVDDGMVLETCFPTVLLDVASSIEMRLDSALSTIEAARSAAV